MRFSIRFSYRVALQDVLHEDARRDDVIGIDRARLDEVLDLGDRDARRGRHHRVEVARRPAVHEVADAVALPGLHEREVGRAAASRARSGRPSMIARLLAFGDERAVAGRREEAADAGAAGANPLGERALRHQLDLDLAGQELPLELLVLADVGRDHLPDLPRLEQDADAEVVDAGVVADDA